MKTTTYYVQMKTGDGPNDVHTIPHTNDQCEFPVHGKATQFMDKLKGANQDKKFRVVTKTVVVRPGKWK